MRSILEVGSEQLLNTQKHLPTDSEPTGVSVVTIYQIVSMCGVKPVTLL